MCTLVLLRRETKILVSNILLPLLKNRTTIIDNVKVYCVTSFRKSCLDLLDITMSLLTYKYYDSPEGHDIYKKVFVTNKYATITGLLGATFDVLMFSHPKGFVNTAGRYMFYIGPLVGMATAFTVTTNVAQNFRNKNDGVNYFLGGVAAGTIVSAWARSLTVAVPACLTLGAFALVKKTAVDNGWILIPQLPATATNTIRSARYDWTMVKDIEELKTWTTGTK